MMAKGIEGCCKGVRVETTSLLQRRLCETLGMRSKCQQQSMLPVWYLIRLCPYTAKVGVSLLIEILICDHCINVLRCKNRRWWIELLTQVPVKALHQAITEQLHQEGLTAREGIYSCHCF
jgi:hypothetical protein